jgi:predicted transcriptional regulator of viral defense system
MVIIAGYTDDISAIAREHSGIVTARQVTDAGIPRRVLSDMTASGHLVRIERGIYLLEGSWEDEFLVYSLRYPKGIFSYDTALYLHGLTDAVPQVFTMTFPQGYNTKSLANTMLDVRRAESALLGLGKALVSSPSGNPVSSYSRERTLCDILRGSEADDSGRASVAYQRYCSASDKDIATLLDYAACLRVTTRVQNYLKALL